MLDRSLPAADERRVAPPGRPQPRWPLAFLGVAGVMGAAGVAVGAAGAHVGGGDLARTASEFLLVHAAALLGAAGAALRVGTLPLAIAMALLALGAALFGGELATAALWDWRPVPLAAPAGGLCLIAGWLFLVPSAIAVALGRR